MGGRSGRKRVKERYREKPLEIGNETEGQNGKAGVSRKA